METNDDATVLKKTLNNIFGYHDFENEDQEKIINEVFRGNSDVYIDRYSRSGTSICFQLPAVLKNNSLTVVFVPTKILGQIQVNYLKQRNINAEYLCCNKWKDLNKNGWESLSPENMKLQFLYVSTDKKTRIFVEDLVAELNSRRHAVSFIVFDGAQCISPSSHNYLQSYREVARSVKLRFRNIRKIAIAETATPEMKNDIINELGMNNPRIFCPEWQSTTYHEVYFIDTLPEPIEDLKNFFNENIGSVWKETSGNPRKFGIIFCRKKQAVKSIEKELSSLGLPVASYHGDLSVKDKVTLQERWIAGKIAVLATTKNFPTGLDGPNVSFIVHWSMPMSIQQLYQECGRFVQNGKNSWCRVYSSMEEHENILRYIQSLKILSDGDADIVKRKHQNLNEMIDYCLQKTCRLTTIMAYFGSTVSSCRFFCDVCRDFNKLEHRVDQFLRFRTAIKQLMIANHESKQIEPLPFVKSKNASEWSRADREKREKNFNSLLGELTHNYTETGGEIGTSIRKDNLEEIARKIEYSLFVGAETRQKYDHDIVQTIHSIRISSLYQSTCSHIRYFKSEGTSLRHEIPVIAEANDDKNEYERPTKKFASETDRSAIEIIDLVDDSDSGSETP